MKKIICALMLVLGMSVLSSCEKADDGFESIVGTWQGISAEGWGMSEVAPDDEETFWHFEKDGTFIEVVTGKEIDVFYGKWSLSGNSLYLLVEDDTYNLPFVFTILELKKDELSLSLLGVTVKYKRVSDSVVEKYL